MANIETLRGPLAGVRYYGNGTLSGRLTITLMLIESGSNKLLTAHKIASIKGVSA